MNELIKVEINENQEPIISGRELHERLGIDSKYLDWFKRMVDYGFEQNVDFIIRNELSQKKEGSRLVNREITNHFLKLDMAKEIAMLQRNEKGKKIRQYFLEIEKEYNSPEKIMARALRIADKEIQHLKLDNKIKDQQISELQPKASYYDVILNTTDLLSVSQIAKDYGMSAKKFNQLLNELGIQYKQGGVWLLYQNHASYGYTSPKTVDYSRIDGTIGSQLHTYWTQKGRLFLYNILQKNGITPIIEK